MLQQYTYMNFAYSVLSSLAQYYKCFPRLLIYVTDIINRHFKIGKRKITHCLLIEKKNLKALLEVLNL